MINHEQVIIKEYLTGPWHGGIVPIAVTEGKTFILSEQEIDLNTEIKIAEIKPGKIIVPRVFLKVEVEGVIKRVNLAIDVERIYEETQAIFGLIEGNILSRFLEILPKGKGVYYMFSTRSDPVSKDTWLSSNEVAMIWAEKVRRTL